MIRLVGVAAVDLDAEELVLAPEEERVGDRVRPSCLQVVLAHGQPDDRVEVVSSYARFDAAYRVAPSPPDDGRDDVLGLEGGRLRILWANLRCETYVRRVSPLSKCTAQRRRLTRVTGKCLT